MQITEYVNAHKKTGLSILCAVALCLCIGILAPHFSNAATYQRLTDQLDEKNFYAFNPGFDKKCFKKNKK